MPAPSLFSQTRLVTSALSRRVPSRSFNASFARLRRSSGPEQLPCFSFSFSLYFFGIPVFGKVTPPPVPPFLLT